MQIIYSILVHLYYFAIYIASFFDSKAKKWIQGRTKLFAKLSRDFAQNNAPVVWFHCASLGEFEQGRPVMEALKQRKPYIKILVTFFSPSGYEVVAKQNTVVDFISYLPLDTQANAKRFIEIVRPQVILFIKYEFWFNFLSIIAKKKIPLILFSAVFRKEQIFFQWYGGFFRNILNEFTHIFVQNQASLDLLYSIDINSATITSDTRLDRVRTILENKEQFPLIEKFKNNQKLLIVGSSWRRDLEVIIPFLNEFDQPLKVIIAPHEIKENEIKYIQTELTTPALRYSEATEENVNQYDALILDNVGMLAQLYQYADFAYIGGAFGEGLHNILEPAVHGIPIFFGKEYQNFPEAIDLIELDVAFSVENTKELDLIFTRIYYDADKRSEIKAACEKYIKENSGGTEVLVSYIIRLLNVMKC
ncbi:MAG: 3-deoxy-D-manno-octulosonic acid transferase [Microscillaceae bacterium]|nr:3-deoxy-D-manno-octulosonic acid transferase [Microscillaceae bacterium]MDW8459983.1 glycosyltransferase N-terminal domain-containing protein [Cytophagales bacterium]